MSESAPGIVHNLMHSPRALGAAVLSGVMIGPFGLSPAFGQSPATTAPNVPAASADPSAQYYSEYTPPAGPTKGVAMVIHGGSWALSGEQWVTEPTIREEAHVAREAGYATLNVDYPPAAAAWPVLLSFYDRAKQIAGDLPVVEIGDSAGGTWALMVAEAKGADGVVTQGAPVDLTRLPVDPNTMRGAVRQAAEAAFAPGLTDSVSTQKALWAWSPLRNARHLKAGFIGVAKNDPIVSTDQSNLLAGIRGIKVENPAGPGPAHFTHSPGISTAAAEKFKKDEVGFLRGITRKAFAAIHRYRH